MKIPCIESLVVIFLELQIFILLCGGQQLPPKNILNGKTNRLKAEKLPPCKACSVLVQSFNTGMEKTSRGKFEGGDTAYEEAKLGSYKYSEVRLVEIQEQLCQDIVRGGDQCHSLVEEYEETIELWWKKQQEFPDLFTYLCIDQAKACCPINHYGPECDICSNCHGNGICKGNGTRKGNGKCNCDTGYKGDSCFECDTGYYESFKDNAKLLCSRCHMACDENGCKGPGSSSCMSCKEGWIRDSEGGCSDIDECLRQNSPCKSNQFCVNNEGSFTCLGILVDL